MIKDKLITVLRIIFGKRPIIVHKEAKIAELAPSQMAQGRTVLVTGGSSGIGLAIAKAFVKAGASVVITGRNITKLQEAQQQLSSLKSENVVVAYIQMDHRDVSGFEKKFQEILMSTGGRPIDILINNAGTRGLKPTEFGIADEESFDAVMETNLKGSYFFSQIVARYMKEHQIHGNILNIASSSSLRPANSAYILSKWGIRAMTLGMAKTLIPYDIVVNGIAPGPTATPMLNKDRSDIHFPQNPCHRLTLPEEIANMAVVLSSPMCRTVVGDILYMTGGAGIITLDDAIYDFK